MISVKMCPEVTNFVLLILWLNIDLNPEKAAGGRMFDAPQFFLPQHSHFWHHHREIFRLLMNFLNEFFVTFFYEGKVRSQWKNPKLYKHLSHLEICFKQKNIFSFFFYPFLPFFSTHPSIKTNKVIGLIIFQWAGLKTLGYEKALI